MSSSPSPKQWLLVIVVNVVVSAITTLLVVRALMAPSSPAASLPAAPPPTTAPVQATQPPAPAAAAAAETPDTALTPTAPADGASAQAGAPTQPVTQTASGSVDDANAASTSSTPAGSVVRISTVLFPGQLSREVVVLVNEGDTIDLTGWILGSSSGIAYTFGNVTLLKDSFINLHTTTGADVPTDLFWNRAEPAWKSGDRLILTSGDQTLATFTVR